MSVYLPNLAPPVGQRASGLGSYFHCAHSVLNRHRKIALAISCLASVESFEYDKCICIVTEYMQGGDAEAFLNSCP